jgi:hypothetical protein
MSGGSWDYFYSSLEDIRVRLQEEKCPHRRALGNQVELLAKAMHDIEWVDSGDWSKGSELPAIKAALGSEADNKAIDVLLKDGSRLIEQLRGLGVE